MVLASAVASTKPVVKSSLPPTTTNGRVGHAVFLAPSCDTPFSQRLALCRKEHDQTLLDLAAMPIDPGSNVTTDIANQEALGCARLCDE